MAACPNVVLTGNVTGAPIFSHSGMGIFAFQIDGDKNLYGLPTGAFVDPKTGAVYGRLDPAGCIPPLQGRVVQAEQIAELVTANQLTMKLNDALHLKMPLQTVAFDVSTSKFDTDDGTLFVVYDIEQPVDK